MVTLALVVISAVLYIYFKVKYYRSKAPIEKKWISTKVNICMGIFLSSFGLNQVLASTTITIVIGSIFILLGVINVYYGYQAYRHYLPLVIQEAKANH